ncbi:MAG TPA: hypothetical protein DDX92_08265 [Flavobacteriales bacterium]|jgi:hypothetical protein|nr:hypothetical protein [Flavobacteriales bacterium]
MKISKLFFPLLFVTLFFSCQKDKCEGVTCENGGICNDGNCNCLFMYDGNRCQDETRTAYYGTYIGESTADNGSPYPDTVILSTNNKGLEYLTWETEFNDLDVILVERKNANVPEQVFLDAGIYVVKVSGSATFDNSTLQMQFLVDFPGNPENVSFVGTKQ